MQFSLVLAFLVDASLRGRTRVWEGTHPLIADDNYDNYDLAVNPYTPERKFPFAVDNLFPEAPADAIKPSESVVGAVVNEVNTNLNLPVVPAHSTPDTFPQDHPFNPRKDGMMNPLVATNGIVAPASEMPEEFYPLYSPFPVSPEDRIPKTYSKYFSEVDFALEGCEQFAGYNIRVAGNSQNKGANGWSNRLWTADSGTQPPGDYSPDSSETRCLAPCKAGDKVVFVDGNRIRKDVTIDSFDAATFKAKISWPTSEPANNDGNHDDTADLRALRKDGKVCIA
jgi:hypothetical protein